MPGRLWSLPPAEAKAKETGQQQEPGRRFRDHGQVQRAAGGRQGRRGVKRQLDEDVEEAVDAESVVAADAATPVSYTHLDVYKRQMLKRFFSGCETMRIDER